MNFLRRLKHSGPGSHAVEQEFRVAKITPQEPRERYLSVACMARNEGRHFREWIEFHRLVGVEHFAVYDNSSDDNTREILEPYKAAGVVDIIPWPHFAPDYDTQAMAYNHALSHFGPKTQWMAFFDLDEFLFSPTTDAVSDILRGYEDLPAICVYWAMFGTSGHTNPVDGTLIENFTNRAPLPQDPVKDPILANYKSIVQPHLVLRNRGAHNFIVDADGSSGFDENRSKIWRKAPRRVTTERLRINHYYTKSLAEWQMRFGRTEGPGTASRDAFLRAAFEKVERAPVEDRTIQHYLPALKKALGRG
jgi:hypothetical protein